MKSAIFKTFFLSLCIIANTHFAYGQTASILPPAKTQFLDNNGKPLTSGTVDFYVPSSTTRKTTWQDSGEVVANTNPVVLDAGGRAKIYGDGSYRQVVKDRFQNLIWDAVTSSTGSGSSAPTATGDGDLVGTIKPWAGMTAPNQYAFTYGQEVSRTTYATLFTAITSTQATFCSSGSPILTGLSDTTNFWVGMAIEIACVAPGFTTIIAKTPASVTMAINANTTTNTNATFFPWGNGNHTTTFNLPDLRGVVPAGNNNMGGVASSNLSVTYFTTNPNSIGALAGSQSKTIISGDIPTLNTTNASTTAVSVSTTSAHVLADPSDGLTTNTAPGGVGWIVSNARTFSSLPSTGTLALNTINTITTSGGIAGGGAVGAAGSGYTNGSQVLTLTGGVCTTFPQFTATVAGNVVTAVVLLTAGSCTSTPSNPAATSGGGGTGATINVAYTAQPFSLIQPTRTTNYIIKITPDANSATASGVTSLGGMTGSIACGTGLLCTGNIISVSISSTPQSGITYVESCGAVGDGVTDDAPAIRTCATQVAAQAYGGSVGFACNKTYLLGTRDPSGLNSTGSILHPFTNVSYVGCGDSSVLKVAAGLNTGVASFTVFYPYDLTNTYSYTNIKFSDFKLDMNGANNTGFNNNNIGIGSNYTVGATVKNITFINNPGSWYVQFGTASAATSSASILVTNNRFGDACDIVNASCLDHSSVYLAATGCIIDNNIFSMASAGTHTTAVEIHGSNCHANNNTINNYSLAANIAAETSLSIVATAFNNNTVRNARFGVWLWALNSQTLTSVSVCNNIFYRTIDPAGGGLGFIDAGYSQGGSAHFTNGNSTTVSICNNKIYSSAAGGTAATEPVIVVGQIKNLEVSGNLITNANGPCIGNNGNAFTTASSFTLKDNTCIDTGQTSTAGSRRGFLFNTVTTIDSLIISGNKMENVASAYMTTGLDMTISSTYGEIANTNLVSNIATVSSITGSGFQVAVANSVPCSAAIGYSFSGTSAFTTGQALLGQASGCPQPKTVSGACTMSAAGVLTCNIATLVSIGTGATCAAIAQNSTVFTGTMGCQSATEASWQTPTSTAGTVLGLRVVVTSTPAAANTYIITIRKNTADTTITCTISNPATTCSDATHTVAFAAGDLLSMKIVTSATSGSVNAVNASVTFLSTN